MDLLTKHLLSAKTEKVKVVHPKVLMILNRKKRLTILTTRGVSKEITKEMKVGLIMIRLDIRIGIKETRRERMIEEGNMYLLEAKVMLQVALARYLYRT